MALKQNDIEIQGPENKENFSYGSKTTIVRLIFVNHIFPGSYNIILIFVYLSQLSIKIRVKSIYIVVKTSFVTFVLFTKICRLRRFLLPWPKKLRQAHARGTGA